MLSKLEKHLKEAFKNIDLYDVDDCFCECGVLTERKDDDKFTRGLDVLYKEIIKTYKENKEGKASLYIPRFAFKFIIERVRDSSRTGYFSFLASATRKQEERIPCVVICVGDDLKEDYDNKNFIKIIEHFKYTVYHELTHFLNYYSYKNEHKRTCTDQQGLIITPDEFNAYYHQFRKYLKDIVDEVVSSKGSFLETFGDSAQDFIDKFWILFNKHNPKTYKQIPENEKYHRKWLKRIYQLYFELMEYYEEIYK
jgi:hypothetical protein